MRWCSRYFYFSFGGHFVQLNNLKNYGRGERFEFGPVVQEEMSFKECSYLELWRPFCSLEQSHLCNFGRGHQEEHFSDFILDQ